MGQVYPDYSPKQGIMRAPVIRVTIGDYLYRVPGFLESVNFTIDNNTPWEINLENDQSGNVAQLPQVVDVSISFKPILDVLPKRANTISTTAVRVDTENSVTTETETITSNVSPLIANVPQAQGSPSNFIQPQISIQGDVTVRESTNQELTRLRNVNQAPPAPIRISPIPTQITRR